MIDSIRRTESTVFIEINTGLCIKEPVIFFRFDTDSEISAELLRKHLYDVRAMAKKRIAKDCLMYLDREEVSKLKSKLLHEWDGNKHDWKRGV